MHKNGAPKEKLIMGMPMYGQSFTLASSSNNGLNAAATGAGNAGPFTRQAGMLAYNEICYRVKHEQWSVKQQSEMGPYAFKGNQWVGYDDVDMIQKKSQYAKDNGYGGGMVWAMGLDDFNNRCGDGRYPLLNAIKDVLGSGSPPIHPTTTKGSHGGEETTTTTYEQTTTKTPNETTRASGGGNCRVTDAYKSFPGMLDWCITTCATGYCPATHCICKN
jgi:chitinase